MDDWDAFDVFKVASLTGDRPLEPVTLAVLQHFDLVDKLRLPDKKLRNYLRVHTSPQDFIDIALQLCCLCI